MKLENKQRKNHQRDKMKCCSRSMCFLEAQQRRYSFVVFLKCDVVTFKETIYMFPEYYAKDYIGSAICLARIVHQEHATLRLYKRIL